MTTRASGLDYREYPPPLRRHLIAVSLLGPAAAASAFGLASWHLTAQTVAFSVMLAALAALAESSPLHLTHKTNINVATSAYIAMLLLLPAGFPGMLALGAIGAAQLIRRRRNSLLDATEMLFNVGQGALSVTAGSVAFVVLARTFDRPTVAGASLLALIAAAGVMHLVNTALVAGAIGLQLGTPVRRVWSRNSRLHAGPHLALTGMGTVAAILAVSEPLLLPFLALPVVLVHRAVRGGSNCGSRPRTR
ncbi:MAG: hypothetical protein ACR2OO_07895 [Thermomicrobiales bacterium]